MGGPDVLQMDIVDLVGQIDAALENSRRQHVNDTKSVLVLYMYALLCTVCQCIVASMTI